MEEPEWKIILKEKMGLSKRKKQSEIMPTDKYK